MSSIRIANTRLNLCASFRAGFSLVIEARRNLSDALLQAIDSMALRSLPIESFANPGRAAWDASGVVNRGRDLRRRGRALSAEIRRQGMIAELVPHQALKRART